MPNSEIETIVGNDNTTTTISCKENGEVSFTHRNYQMDKLAEQIADLQDQLVEQIGDIKVKMVDKDQLAEQIGNLKDQMANHIMELQELMERHMEGN